MAVKTYKKGDKTMVSKNLSVIEFQCHGVGCCNTVLIDTDLVDIVQGIRDHFGQPVTITSGYRCPVHNRNVGGETASRHSDPRAHAADIVVKGVAPRTVAQYAESVGIKGIGLYETAADGYFVHVDARTAKSFWYGQAQAPRSTFGAYTGKPSTPPAATPTTPPSTGGSYTRAQFIRDLQKAIGANADGVAGPETLSKAPTLAAWKNISHPAVLPVQRYLLTLGHPVGAADGVAGPLFTEAVKRYQADTGCKYRDGELTAQNETWRKLLGM